MPTRMTITPDGARYLSPNPPRPFTMRWALPLICRRSEIRWKTATYLGIAITAVSIWSIIRGWQGVAAACLFLALPSVRFNATHPVLVDAMALGLATLSAALWVNGLPIPALICALIAGATKESAPIFAALFAWTPWLLVAMIIPAATYLIRRPGPDPLGGHHAWLLAHPIQASREYHDRWLRDLDPRLLAPWGATVVALAYPTPQLFATLAAAYAQITVATDTVRLYQWAAPVVCIAATMATPPLWWPVILAVTMYNPLRGDGV